MAEDIVATVPYPCDDTECPYQWHLIHYCLHKDGSYTQCNEDGDHTPWDEANVPDPTKQTELWNVYFDFVRETGTDPLREFKLPNRKTTWHRWQARIRQRLGGLMVTGVRRRGRGPWLPLRQASAPVLEYLKPVKDYADLDQLIADIDDPYVRRNPLEMWLTFTVQEPGRPWSEDRLAAWLRRQAREAKLQMVK